MGKARRTRARDVVRPVRPPVESEPIGGTFPIALISIATVLIAAVPLVMLDPQADDGIAVMVAWIGVPAVASAVIVEILRRRLTPDRRLRGGWMWWVFGVVPIGIVLCSIPAILRNREYFVAESVGAMLGALAMSYLVVWIGLLLGAIAWFFVVFPLVHLVSALVLVARGERAGAAGLVMPLAMLTLTAIIIVGALALDDLAPGRMAGGQIVMALLGVPGSYEVVWPAGLWIVRGLVAALVLAAAAPKIRRHLTGAAGGPAGAARPGRGRLAAAAPTRRPRR